MEKLFERQPKTFPNKRHLNDENINKTSFWTLMTLKENMRSNYGRMLNILIKCKTL